MTDARPYIRAEYARYTRRVYEGLLQNPLTAPLTLAATPLFLLMERGVWGDAEDPATQAVRRVMASAEAKFFTSLRDSGPPLTEVIGAFEAMRDEGR